MLLTAASPPPAAADSIKEELADLIRRFMESLTEFSDRLPFTADRQKFRSITTLAAICVTIIFAWKLLRAPPADHQRRQQRQAGSLPGHSGARLQLNTDVPSSDIFSSSGDSIAQDAVDEFFPPVKLTLQQFVRHKLRDGRKVTSSLLGVILEETTPEELQERVLLALKDAGLFAAGGLISDKVLFCSTENGRSSFVRQLEPDWHIDTNPQIIYQLARFIKYQLHISQNRPDRTASNVFVSASLEQFFGGPN